MYALRANNGHAKRRHRCLLSAISRRYRLLSASDQGTSPGRKLQKGRYGNVDRDQSAINARWASASRSAYAASSTVTPTNWIVPPSNFPGVLYSWPTASPLSKPTASPSPDRVNLHGTFGDDLVVHVELGRAQRLVVGTRSRAVELHAERVLAGLQIDRRDELLLRLDAQEIIDVVELVILDEEAMPPNREPWAKMTPEAAGSVISTLARIL